MRFSPLADLALLGAFVSLTLAQTTPSGVSTSRGASPGLPGRTSVDPALSRATLSTALSSSVPSSRPNGAATSRTSSSVTSSSSQVPAPNSRSSTSSTSTGTSLSSISSSVQSSVSSTSNTQPPVATPSSTTASSTTASSTTSSVTTPLLTSAPTATLAPTRTTSTTSGTLTTTVSGGATIIVAAGIVVIGGPGGGTIVVNGVATPIAAGATQVAGGSGSNQDPQRSDDPVTTQPTSSRPTTSSSSTSSSSSSSTSAGCLRYQDPDYPPPDNGDTQNGQGDFNKRDLRLSGRPIAGRIAVPDIQPELEKRAATFGVFSTPRGPTCTIATRVVQPTYPGPGAITRMEALPTGDPGRNEAVFQTAKYWFIGRQDCGALPTYTSVGSNALPTAGSNGDPVGIGGKTKSEGSVDHVWELKFLNDFIESQLSSTSFDCDDLNTVFMSNDASRPAGATAQSRLQTIFDQLPGNGFPDLAGMLQSTNNIKGTVFTPGGLRRLSPRNALLSEAEAALFTLQDISNVFTICNDPAVSQLFSNTNRRIFEAFQGIDDVITNECLTRKVDGAPIPATFASAFSTFMDQRIATANREGFAFATNLVRSSRLATGTVGAAIARFTGSPLFSQDAFSFKFNLNYQGTTPLKLRSLDKRQAACAVRPSSSLGTTTNAATLGPTATPGNTAGPGQSSTTTIVTQGPSETATIVISTDDPSLTTTIAPSPTSTSAPANVVNSNTLCEAGNLNICDASSDGVQRCLALGSPGEDICVATCDAASACPASCTAAGFTFGFCSNGNNPCICSNLAASTGQ